VWIGAEDEWSGELKWQGTGFFVTPNLIATAGHVIQDTESFEVMFSDGTRTKADFIHAEDRERCDVGFIKLRSENRKPRPYLDLDIKVNIGEDLIILGYPWGLNNGVALTKGVMSLPNRNEPYFGTKLVLHTDAAAWLGNSGSPVIDMDGECIGILIGSAYGCDNFSIVTPAKLVEFAMQKTLAEIGLREAE
jgi:serine protease Do